MEATAEEEEAAIEDEEAAIEEEEEEAATEEEEEAAAATDGAGSGTQPLLFFAIRHFASGVVELEGGICEGLGIRSAE